MVTYHFSLVGLNNQFSPAGIAAVLMGLGLLLNLVILVVVCNANLLFCIRNKKSYGIAR